MCLVGWQYFLNWKYKTLPHSIEGKIFNKNHNKSSKNNAKLKFFLVVNGSQFYHFDKKKGYKPILSIWNFGYQ